MGLLYMCLRPQQKVNISPEQLDGLREVITDIFLLDNPWATCRQLSMKSPHFTRLMRPKAPLTWLLCLPDNAQFSPQAANSLSVMAGLPGYPSGSAWTFLLSTPYTTSLLKFASPSPINLPPSYFQSTEDTYTPCFSSLWCRDLPREE